MVPPKDGRISDDELFRMLGGGDEDHIVHDEKRDADDEDLDARSSARRKRDSELSDEELMGLIAEQETPNEPPEEEKEPEEPELPDAREAKERSPREIMDDAELVRLIGGDFSESDLEIAEPAPRKPVRGTRPTKPVSGKVLGELDLHGHTTVEAVEELKAQLKTWKERPGFYHVIVGKGNHSPDGKAVLRRHVYRWLEDEGGAYMVGERRWGKRNEGGSGVIVLRIKPAR